MSNQNEKAAVFKSLHIPGEPIVLFNIWDAGSAAAIASQGVKAIATGSAPVAMAQGFKDGEQMPLSLALANIERIVAAVELPVTMDLESGYGTEPSAVADTVAQAMEAGIVGFNFEDQIIGGDGLYSIAQQTARVKAAADAATSVCEHAYINARTDIFLKAAADTHNETMLAEAIDRANAYEQAGASGLFAPGLKDAGLIEKLCSSVNLPVNIIALPGVPDNGQLAKMGVGRISYGPVPYRHMLQQLKEGVTAALAF